MIQWEYMCLKFTSIAIRPHLVENPDEGAIIEGDISDLKLEAKLEDVTEKGWELVSSDYCPPITIKGESLLPTHILWFKRLKKNT